MGLNNPLLCLFEDGQGHSYQLDPTQYLQLNQQQLLIYFGETTVTFRSKFVSYGGPKSGSLRFHQHAGFNYLKTVILINECTFRIPLYPAVDFDRLQFFSMVEAYCIGLGKVVFHTGSVPLLATLPNEHKVVQNCKNASNYDRLKACSLRLF